MHCDATGEIQPGANVNKSKAWLILWMFTILNKLYKD